MVVVDRKYPQHEQTVQNKEFQTVCCCADGFFSDKFFCMVSNCGSCFGQVLNEKRRDMRVVLQRVKEANVSVDGQEIGAIGHGFLLLLGAAEGDTEQIADKMVDKICKLRIFPDDNGKTNLSLADVGGEILVVSQFTLYADCKKGNRPSFIKAGAPDMANCLYEHVIERCRLYVDRVEHGIFGADMKVSLVNDGPFTLVLDSEELISH